MENSVRMMLMDVKRYLVLRDNNVLTMLHHWWEQNVLVLRATLQAMILNVLVSNLNIVI